MSAHAVAYSNHTWPGGECLGIEFDPKPWYEQLPDNRIRNLELRFALFSRIGGKSGTEAFWYIAKHHPTKDTERLVNFCQANSVALHSVLSLEGFQQWQSVKVATDAVDFLLSQRRR